MTGNIFSDEFLDKLADDIVERVTELVQAKQERTYVTMAELSEKTGYAISTLSTMIKKMEEETGGGTIRTGGKGVRIHKEAFYEFMETKYNKTGKKYRRANTK